MNILNEEIFLSVYRNYCWSMQIFSTTSRALLRKAPSHRMILRR